ncbi:MAG TPA: hydantoinase/oxoprolinase family protein [Hyphomicrobium sp.]|nr:hydantoinase/oxoprolinase family protein [Hyphomicrobium sp.]
MGIVVGLDVGGAHVKAARLENGQITEVRQLACPLWLGLDRLDAMLRELRTMTDDAARVAITMTAELTEIFPSRDEGAMILLQRLAEAFGSAASYFMGLKGFGDLEEALHDPASVSSANFLASAKAVSARRPGVLLIDMGSTTTDIIPCDRPQGLSDAERLQTGELVYTGFTRTPVPSVTTRAPLLGTWQTLARDTFATMADVRRLLGELPEGIDNHATADGRSKSLPDSLRRFARGFGRDGEERHLPVWQAAATYVRERQIRSICDGALQVLSRPGLTISGVAAAGIGASVAEAVARRLGFSAITFGGLIGAPIEHRAWATRCAPAVAVALALTQEAKDGKVLEKS